MSNKNEFFKTEKEIRDWLEEHDIKNYQLIPDKRYTFVVNVNDHVNISNRGLKWVPVKFGKVSGDLACNNNQLTSLEFCPKRVNGGFYCDNNELTSLEFCPKYIGGDFDCSSNNILSLEFCVKKIHGNFYCNKNKLESLVGCPEEILNNFYCNNNY